MEYLLVWYTAGAALAAPLAAQVVLVDQKQARFEIPIGGSIRQSWQWYRPSTPTNAAEYIWTVSIQRDSVTHTIGFFLFKRPDAQPASGPFGSLRRAGQVSYAVGVGHRERVVREVRPEVDLDERALIITLTDSARVAAIFGHGPRKATFHLESPDQGVKRVEVPITYEGLEREQRLMAIDSLAVGRERWRRAGVAEYRLQASYSCFCSWDDTVPPRNLFTVRGGRIVDSALGTRDGLSPSPRRWTVDSLFAIIRDHLREGSDNTATLEIDPRFGFPRYYKSQSRQIPDIWLVISVDSFAVVRTVPAAPKR